MKRALVTGITGQDGSYLAEFLLSKGYRVHGLVRRSSTVPFERIHHLRDRIELVHGDLLDPSSLNRALETSQADEVYNLAAQSFVPTSWTEPVLTAEFTAVGVTRVLEAIRQVNPKIRFYQASSSEMFGKVQQVPQTEQTSFYPRSPYGVSKVFGHWITVNYRESYGLFACSGILFNHECVPGSTPVVVRRRGAIDVVPMEDLVPHPKAGGGSKRAQTIPKEETEVWDREGFTRVKLMSARWSEPGTKDARVVVTVSAPGAYYRATKDHISFVDGGSEGPTERPTGDLQPGDRLVLAPPAPAPSFVVMTEDEAWLLGVLSVSGSVVERDDLRVASERPELLEAVDRCWRRLTAGTTDAPTAGSPPRKGTSRASVELRGAPRFEATLADELLTPSGERRVPKRVLNGEPAVRLSYLRGCRDAVAAHQGAEDDRFRSIETSSQVLAAGIWWLARTTLDEKPRLRVTSEGTRETFRVAFDDPAEHESEIGRLGLSEHRGWLFDLETESGTFHAGVGDGWIHNSPRRGLEFVTRKVSDGVARILTGVAKDLRLGNLDAKRDWGYAGDYVDAMWRMLQLDEPDDYVIATGETHSVRELCEIAFARVGLDWEKHVVIDPKFLRPAEVDLLIGDASKARQKLGWTPKTTFKELVEMMVDADVERAKRLQGKA